MKDNDLKERLFHFATGVLKLLGEIKGGKEIDVVKYQLSKSATSAGANYEEAQGSVSKAEFISKVSISLKEMRESHYWLRIIKDLNKTVEKTEKMLNESEELGKILASILIKARSNPS
ncbi:MAG: four helix bundle protein [Bacteroidales bacterium]